MLHSFCSRFGRQVVKFIKRWPPATAVSRPTPCYSAAKLQPLESGRLISEGEASCFMHPEEYIMLVFALRVCYCVSTGEDEGQNVLVGNLRLPGPVSDIDLLFFSFFFLVCFLQLVELTHRRSVHTLIVNCLMEP